MKKVNTTPMSFKTVSCILLAFLFVLSLSSCKKCKNENPRAKITNNGTKDASVQIKTSDGNTVNINNVASKTSSDYASYAAGDITFTITVDKANYVKVVPMSTCFEYNIAIDGNNTITTVPTDRNN